MMNQSDVNGNAFDRVHAYVGDAVPDVEMSISPVKKDGGRSLGNGEDEVDEEEEEEIEGTNESEDEDEEGSEDDMPVVHGELTCSPAIFSNDGKLPVLYHRWI
jgi:hypothetical protein